jgi:chromosome segregation ATPase
LYRPADNRLKKSQVEVTQTAGQLEQTRQDLSKSQQDLKTAQDQADQAKTRLEALQTRAQVLNAMNAVVTAKLAVSNNNKNAAATALGDAQAGLDKIQPQLQKIDAAQVSSIQALFTLSRVDLDRDLKLALQDLDRLQTELNRMDQNFQNP